MPLRTNVRRKAIMKGAKRDLLQMQLCSIVAEVAATVSPGCSVLSIKQHD